MDETIQDQAVVTLTENAADHVRSLLAKDPEAAGKTLRVFVEGGGCSGLQYGMLFDEKRADDAELTFHGVSVLVDPHSAEHLRGAVIDFKDGLNESGFKISNPNARQSCGCGKSFCG
jgi:iron-sulfur cluster assembly accessory protein